MPTRWALLGRSSLAVPAYSLPAFQSVARSGTGSLPCFRYGRYHRTRRRPGSTFRPIFELLRLSRRARAQLSNSRFGKRSNTSDSHDV